MNLPNLTKHLKSSLEKQIESLVSQGKTKFYFREIIENAHITMGEAEDSLLPLLEKNKLEGSLELRCPECGADLGIYEKYTEIQKQINCEICSYEFPLSDDYLEIILEVKGDFFRSRKTSSSSCFRKTIQI